MSDGPGDEILLLLREIRGGMRRMDAQLYEVARRLGRAEAGMAELRAETAGLRWRLERMEGQVGRWDTRPGRLGLPAGP